VLEGLREPIQKGVLHRDIKLDNRRFYLKQGMPILIDFGAARIDFRKEICKC